MGVRQKRAVAAAVDYWLAKQALGFKAFLRYASCPPPSACSSSSGQQPFTHIAYLHLWDETQIKRRSASEKQGAVVSKIGIRGHSILQRGVVAYSADRGTGQSETFTVEEQWLALPLQVESTSADCLLPAVLKAMPEDLAVDDDMAGVCRLAKAVGFLTFHPFCDRASANLMMIKRWAHLLEEEASTQDAEGASCGVAFLLWPDTCNVHLAARGKLVLADVKHHLTRQFSLCNLLRLHSVRKGMSDNIEALVAKKLRRQVAPHQLRAPCSATSLTLCLTSRPGTMRGATGASRTRCRRSGRTSHACAISSTATSWRTA